MKYRTIVIGSSAGGIDAIEKKLKPLKKGFPAAVLIVQHLSNYSSGYMIKHLNDVCNINVKEADEKEKILLGNVYVAPANYHLLAEKDETMSFTVDPKVNHSRPAIEVLFESAAEVYRDELIGIILTGASSDGSKELKKIKDFGGIIIVQDPGTAESIFMPNTAIKAVEVDYILTLDEIRNKLIELVVNINEKQK